MSTLEQSAGECPVYVVNDATADFISAEAASTFVEVLAASEENSDSSLLTYNPPSQQEVEKDGTTWYRVYVNEAIIGEENPSILESEADKLGAEFNGKATPANLMELRDASPIQALFASRASTGQLPSLLGGELLPSDKVDAYLYKHFVKVYGELEAQAASELRRNMSTGKRGGRFSPTIARVALMLGIGAATMGLVACGDEDAYRECVDAQNKVVPAQMCDQQANGGGGAFFFLYSGGGGGNHRVSASDRAGNQRIAKTYSSGGKAASFKSGGNVGSKGGGFASSHGGGG